MDKVMMSAYLFLATVYNYNYFVIRELPNVDKYYLLRLS